MKGYSPERKESVLRKMMPPINMPVSQIAKESGISDVTLYKWRNELRDKGKPAPGNGLSADKWSAEDKFAVLLETSELNEAELSEYCRKKGLYAEQRSGPKKLDSRLRCIPLNRNLQDDEEKTVLT